MKGFNAKITDYGQYLTLTVAGKGEIRFSQRMDALETWACLRDILSWVDEVAREQELAAAQLAASQIEIDKSVPSVDYHFTGI